MTRRLHSLALGGVVAVACALCGGASASASLPLHSLGKPTKRRVHLSLDGREIAPPVAVIRLDLDQPAYVVSALPKDPPRIVHATIEGLRALQRPQDVARRRGKTVEEVAPAYLLRPAATAAPAHSAAAGEA